MAIFKCKMCGGALEVNEEITVVECDYCGSKQTVSTKKDEVITNLFNRANNLRLKNEFDKAAEVYNKILNENDADAEAHWGLVLCKYGIEYVEDPKTYKRIPTCHRTQYTSVLSDTDYLAAIENADVVSKEVYTAEAHEIAELQKSILAIVKDEKPFDVFICYKETDENGKRTIDSALANDIYYQLTKEGLRVFYAAITLEDKLGVEYEPYIFAALNSAKVMLAIGTKPEYFNAVWVKNEWSRYLGIMKTDREKMLIPCYRDMDAYDLPEEFAHLQAQDMSKIGFINDLVRGIKKVTVKEEAPTVVKETVVNGNNTNIAPLLKRAFMFLEDSEWANANEYCEKVLDIDPECAEAYVGKLMANLKIRRQKELKGNNQPFDKNNNYQKAIRFADASLKEELEGYTASIKERNLNAAYTKAAGMMDSARTEKEFKIAAAEFEKINDYKDSASKVQICLEKAEAARLEKAYSVAMSSMSSANSEKDFKNAASKFERIKDYKDSASKMEICLEKAEELRLEDLYKAEELRLEDLYNVAISAMSSAKSETDFKSVALKFKDIKNYKDSAKKAEEAIATAERIVEEKRIADEKAKAEAEVRAKKNKTIGAIVASIVAVVLAVVIVFTTVIIPNGKFEDAVTLMEAGKYEEAISAFKALDGHKDSKDKINECNYLIAEDAYENGEILKSAIYFGKNAEYKDSITRSKELWSKNFKNKTIAARESHTVALKSDGTVVTVGDNASGQCDVSDWTDIVEISTGANHTVGLKSNGTVVAVGSNYYGQCDVSGWTDIVAISAGHSFTVGLKSNGTVVAVGHNDFNECDVSDWTDIVAIAAGDMHTVGLKLDGTVVTVGDNDSGQCDVSGWTDIIAISSGTYHTVGLKLDGTVVAIGSNAWGQCDVSDWTDIVAISTCAYHTVGLKSDGTVVAVGYNDERCDVDDWTNIVAISAGVWHTVGLKSDGTVVAIGSNALGQCDVDNFTNIKLP